MPSTSRGYPYPSGSDDVDIPGDIQALADAVNTDVGTIAATTPSAPVLQTLADAAGDLAVGSAADTFGKLALGTDNYALTVNTGGAGVAKIGWEDPTANPLTSAALALKVDDATVGNLLTANQASLESNATTGWVLLSDCTIAASSAQAKAGTYSLAATYAGAAYGDFYTSASIPVVAGQTYTASVQSRAATTARSVAAGILWFNSGNTYQATTNGTGVTNSASGWTRSLVTAVAPAGAAYARPFFRANSAANLEVHYFDEIGLWEGAGGQWALPGTPITNLGFYTDESVGRRLFQWDANNSRFQQTFGDTGWRGISEWTAANTGLLADVTGVALNPTGADGTTQQGGFLPTAGYAGGIYLRRIGNTVYVRLKGLTVPALSATAGKVIWTTGSVPTGFRMSAGYGVVPMTWTTGEAWSIGAGNASNMLQIYRPTGSGSAAISAASPAETSYQTDVAWPTTLPGTASGSIPA